MDHSFSTYAKFFKKLTFLSPDKHTYLCPSGGKKCWFFGKFGVPTKCIITYGTLGLPFTTKWKNFHRIMEHSLQKLWIRRPFQKWDQVYTWNCPCNECCEKYWIKKKSQYSVHSLRLKPITAGRVPQMLSQPSANLCWFWTKIYWVISWRMIFFFFFFFFATYKTFLWFSTYWFSTINDSLMENYLPQLTIFKPLSKPAEEPEGSVQHLK